MILLLLLLVSQSSCLTSSLKQHLTLHKDELKIKRFGQNIILSVDLFNRTFVASLSPYREIFHKQFSVVGVDTAQSWHVDYNINDHYEGAIENEPASLVRIHLHEGVITGTIILEGETIFIEPSWRHIKEQHVYHMIVYKMSDLLYNFGSREQPGHFCGHNHSSEVKPTVESPYDFDFKILHTDVQNKSSSRFKRSKSKKDTCGIILVADYKFYREVCQGSETITTSFLITLFDRVNRIFKKTYFASTDDPDYMGYGMNVKKVLIHTARDTTTSHYNYSPKDPKEGKDWDVSELLDTFGSGAKTDAWSSYCLAHLFTNIDFDNGVLGLAYVASPIR